MRFDETCYGWTEKRSTQAEAAKSLGVGDRTFRRDVGRIPTRTAYRVPAYMYGPHAINE
jgi:hypothetical protein